MTNLCRDVCTTVVCVLFTCFSAPSWGQGQVVYTVTGTVGVGSGGNLAGETFLAEFLIDTSVADVDPDSGRGSYPGAIISSSLTYSGGLTSIVDFAGGEIIILQDIAGGAIGIDDLNDQGIILIGSIDNPFESDALLTDPGTQVTGDPFTLFSLIESVGRVIAFSDVDLSPITFTISASGGVLAGDTNLDGVVDLLDVAPFVNLILNGLFQAEADLNGDGVVDLLDIQPFVDLLL